MPAVGGERKPVNAPQGHVSLETEAERDATGT
jgi:hypothetical protein